MYDLLIVPKKEDNILAKDLAISWRADPIGTYVSGRTIYLINGYFLDRRKQNVWMKDGFVQVRNFYDHKLFFIF